ncbi:Pyridoxamine 5'-phosphate oxidase [compost metagenome]
MHSLFGLAMAMTAVIGVTFAAPRGSAAAPSPAPAPEARRLLAKERVGTLSTQSVAMPGYPFGSLTPYALDAQGRPILLISTLSQHTRNIEADSRVSLLVYDTAHADVHDAPRLTWVGRAVPVPAADTGAKARYLARFPEASRFFKAHDFKLYTLTPVRGYYIGGFDRIFWIEPKDLVVA